MEAHEPTAPQSAFRIATELAEVAHAPSASVPSLEGRLAELRKIKLKRRLMSLALVGSDALACLLGVSFAQLAFGQTIDLNVAVTVLISAFPIYFLAAMQTGAHNLAIARRPAESIKSAGIAFVVTAAIFFFAVFAAKIGSEVSRLQVGQTLAFTLLFGAAGRYAVALRSRELLGPQPFADLCIYDDVPFKFDSGRGAIRAVEAGIDPDLARPEMVARLGELARSMDRVVVHCSPKRREIWARALRCVDIRSEIVMPELNQLMPLDIRYRLGEVSLVLANGPLRWHQRWTKAIFDFGATTLVLIPAVPLMAVIAIAVKLSGPGPVFFRQVRVGLGNRRFRIWKFRTMHAERTDHDGAVSAGRQDDRVTAVGRFLRRTSLDELPQLFNVMAGQMSLVGPRPHALKSLAGLSLFWEVSDDYWFRHTLKPGITGLAQIRGHRGNTVREEDLRERLHADLEYVANWTLLGDIRILIQTCSVIHHKNAF